MTINLTELKDEPLEKHPIQAAHCAPRTCRLYAAQGDVAADRVSTSTFDVDSLNDEALDARPVGVVLCSAGGLCN